MGVESVAIATTVQGAVPNAASVVERSVRPVIDIETIKTILYLGMKGEITYGSEAGGRSPTRQSGVDTYA